MAFAPDLHERKTQGGASLAAQNQVEVSGNEIFLRRYGKGGHSQLESSISLIF